MSKRPVLLIFAILTVSSLIVAESAVLSKTASCSTLPNVYPPNASSSIENFEYASSSPTLTSTPTPATTPTPTPYQEKQQTEQDINIGLIILVVILVIIILIILWKTGAFSEMRDFLESTWHEPSAVGLDSPG